MNKKLILVDYENIQKIDLSILDDSYSAIIFVGAKQNQPKASKNKATAHRFSRVDFHKIEGTGKNALDFHIAFQLGRTIETEPHTECFVLSKDKGFDPLLSHLNKNGLKCRRVSSIDELIPQPSATIPTAEDIVCKKCGKASTIEHHGGRWCTNCGCFASPADPKKLPSNQPGYQEYKENDYYDSRIMAECGWCHQKTDMTGGIYDDGEWMCGNCIARYAS
ncbi:MAG: PIN domain-containing protein [Polaromonas sp.]